MRELYINIFSNTMFNVYNMQFKQHSHNDAKHIGKHVWENLGILRKTMHMEFVGSIMICESIGIEYNNDNNPRSIAMKWIDIP